MHGAWAMLNPFPLQRMPISLNLNFDYTEMRGFTHIQDVAELFVSKYLNANDDEELLLCVLCNCV